MQQLLKAAALSTCFLALTAGSCEKRIVEALPIPPERMDCVAIDKRPAIPPEYVIDWSQVTTVSQARAEHDAYVRSVRTREGIVVGHIVALEGRLFACSSDAQWLREWSAGIANP